jgi:uncharacterized protein (DUF433 family)
MGILTTVHSDPVPLRVDEAGGLRVGDTRVQLETVLTDFRSGSSPEAIVEHFPSLDLADVYAVIAYCLRHREEIEEYMRRRDEEAEEIRRKIEARQEPRMTPLREKIRQRRAQMERQGDASSGD